MQHQEIIMVCYQDRQVRLREERLAFDTPKIDHLRILIGRLVRQIVKTREIEEYLPGTRPTHIH
jgi:hypothetical protein